MQNIISQTDAAALVQLITTVAIPFLISLLKQVQWKPIYKFGLAVGLSVVAGALTSFADGTLRGTLVANTSEIFIASQIIYYSAFKSLGLEQAIAPKTALADKLKDEVVNATVAPLTQAQAQDVLKQDTPSQIVLTADTTLVPDSPGK